MANHFALTTALSNGTWGAVTKPIIKEAPEYNDQMVALPRRIIRVMRQTKEFSDDTSNANALFTAFTIQIRAPNATDIDNIVNKIRDILAAQTSIFKAFIAKEEEISERARWNKQLTVMTQDVDRRA